MLKKLMSVTANSMVAIILAGSGLAFSPAMAQQKPPTQQQMLDALLGGDNNGFGASRGISVGAPAEAKTPEKREQRKFMRNFFQQKQTRAPALPGPSLPQGSAKGAAVKGAAVKGAVIEGAPALPGPSLPPGKIKSAAVKSAPVMTKADRQKLTSIIKQNKLPGIDLEIYFDYNSSAISPKSIPDLVRLGQVLVNPRLAGSTFLVAGHTDATGGARYNLSLSQRRARSVQEFLRASFGIKPGTLVAVGYGEEQLKNGSNPSAAENRRVQIVNLARMQ